MEMDLIQKKLLEEVADLQGIPEGDYNIRRDGKLAGGSITEQYVRSHGAERIQALAVEPLIMSFLQVPGCDVI